MHHFGSWQVIKQLHHFGREHLFNSFLKIRVDFPKKKINKSQYLVPRIRAWYVVAFIPWNINWKSHKLLTNITEY